MTQFILILYLLKLSVILRLQCDPHQLFFMLLNLFLESHILLTHHRLHLLQLKTEKTTNHPEGSFLWTFTDNCSQLRTVLIVTCSVWADSFSCRSCSVACSCCLRSLLLASASLSLFFSSWSSSSTAAPVKELSGLSCRQNRCSSQITTKCLDICSLSVFNVKHFLSSVSNSLCLLQILSNH